MIKTESAKISSTLMQDINRIRKACDKQTRMNTLRKHQIKLYNFFLEKLLKEGRITKEELKSFTPKKKDAAERLFGLE